MTEQHKIIDLLQQSLNEKTKELEETRERLIEVCKTMTELLEYILKDKEINTATYNNINSIIKKGFDNLKDKV